MGSGTRRGPRCAAAVSPRRRLCLGVGRILSHPGGTHLGGGQVCRAPPRLPAGAGAPLSRRARGLYPRPQMDDRERAGRPRTFPGHFRRRRFSRRQPDSGDAAGAARPPTAAPGGRHRPVADHRFDAGERFAADGQRSHHQCENHARVPGPLSGEDRSPQSAGLARLRRLPRHSAAADSGRRARDAPRRQHPRGEEGSFGRDPGEARSLARHVPCVPVPRAASS